jgi:hypothetical protein
MFLENIDVKNPAGLLASFLGTAVVVGFVYVGYLRIPQIFVD